MFNWFSKKTLITLGCVIGVALLLASQVGPTVFQQAAKRALIEDLIEGSRNVDVILAEFSIDANPGPARYTHFYYYEDAFSEELKKTLSLEAYKVAISDFLQTTRLTKGAPDFLLNFIVLSNDALGAKIQTDYLYNVTTCGEKYCPYNDHALQPLEKSDPSRMERGSNDTLVDLRWVTQSGYEFYVIRWLSLSDKKRLMNYQVYVHSKPVNWAQMLMAAVQASGTPETSLAEQVYFLDFVSQLEIK